MALIETLDLTLAPPGRLTMPYLTGGAVEGGRSLSGVVTALNLTGGPLVAVAYKQISLGNTDPAGMRYISRLAAMLNSGVRSIMVPLFTDFIAPTTGVRAAQTPFSDASTFSDTSLFTQSIIGGIILADAPVNASSLTISVVGKLTGGEWFEITHPTKLARAYCITDIESFADNGGGQGTYVVDVQPPLREGVTAGASANFMRPRCLMRLAPGTNITMDVQPYWWATPDISFIESFGTV